MELISIKCDETSEKIAVQLSNFLDAPIIIDDHRPETRFVLEIRNNTLGLNDMSRRGQKLFFLNFDYQRESLAHSRQDPLLRAIGRNTKSVIDATAGWCSDALHMARHGIKVLAIENNPLIVAMLRDAQNKATDPIIHSHFSLVHGDSINLLDNGKIEAEVVFLDPMYPQKSNPAAAKKEISILRDLIGYEQDNSELFQRAMQVASKRVVVKRPHHAEPIAPGKVGEIKTKLVRFDIFKPDQKPKI